MIRFGNSKALVNHADDCVIFHSKFVQVQRVRVKRKLNYPSQFLHMF